MKKQKGIGLLEILATIAIISVMLMGLARMANDANKQTKGTVTAQQFSQIMDASVRYIQDNSATIQAAATATVPSTITTAMLQATNYLSASFVGTNPYGQAVQVEVLQPVAGNLQAAVISLNGTTIPDMQAAGIATKVGAQGGYTPSATPTIANGPFGGWSMPLTNNTKPGAGHLVGLLYFNNGQLVTDYLRRHVVPGHPELNSMYTPLNMRAVTTVNTSDALCIVGDATTYGRIAVDNTGAVLSCQSGIWKTTGSAFWLDPVANYAALSLISTDPTGAVRATLDTDRAFMWNGVSWEALAVDQNGNMSMTGTITAGYVQPSNVVVANTACSSNGLIAQDSSGLILSCQSGVWAKEGSNTVKQKLNSAGYAIPTSIPDGFLCKFDGFNTNYFSLTGFYAPTNGSYLYVGAGSVWISYSVTTLAYVSNFGFTGSPTCLTTSNTWVAPATLFLNQMQAF